MEKASMKKPALFLALLLLLLSRAAGAEPVHWENLPAPAQHAITLNSQGQKVYLLEKERVQGVLMFEAIVIKPDTSKIIIKVGPQGQIYDVRSRATLF
jgi:hypothetical protein